MLFQSVVWFCILIFSVLICQCFLKNKIHRPHWHLTDPDEQECDTYSIFILSLFSILSLTGAIKEKDSFTRSEIISGSP